MPDDLLTTKEAAEACGLKNTSSIRYAIDRGDLPATKYGNVWLIKREDLEQWKQNPAFHRTGPKTK